MDSKIQIRLDQNEEELVDLSIGHSAACSIFVIMGKGIQPIKDDIDQMRAYILQVKNKNIPFNEMPDIEREKIIKNITEQLTIAELCNKQGTEFIKELMRVIKELEPKKEKPKIIIHKPNWP